MAKSPKGDTMIELDNRTEVPIKTFLLEQIADLLTSRDLELIITDDSEIAKMNREFRNIDKPTDVLSFPLEEVPNTPLGTIVISMDQAMEKARELGHTLEDEIALLFLHGLLHLLGYDHETDEGQMRQKEEEVVRELGLPESLIVRTKES